MKFSMRQISLCAILLTALFTLAEQTAAQVSPGTYRLVGALGRPSNSGFFGIVTIERAGPVDVRLNNGFILRGRIEADGDFTVTSVRRGRTRLTAFGRAEMQSGTYAIGDVRVPGQGRGIIMLGRLF